MIIWISGPYGVGKSTLAEALENAMIFDAEEVGNAVRGNYPNDPYGYIFEDYPLWSVFCCQLLKDIHSTFRKNILVPMTLVRSASYENIVQKLLDDGVDVKLIILEANYANVHDRILARGEEEDCWCMENIEMSSSASKAIEGGYHICTDGKAVAEIAESVLDYIGSSSYETDEGIKFSYTKNE